MSVDVDDSTLAANVAMYSSFTSDLCCLRIRRGLVFDCYFVMHTVVSMNLHCAAFYLSLLFVNNLDALTGGAD